MPQNFPIANFSGLFIVNRMVTKSIWGLLQLGFGEKTDNFSGGFHNRAFSSKGPILGKKCPSQLQYQADGATYSLIHIIGSYLELNILNS